MIGPAITTLATFTADHAVGLVLAQGPLNGGNVPRLPSPPFLGHLLFESPWPAIIVLVFAAVVVFITSNQKARARSGLLMAGGLVAIAIAIWFSAHFVMTTREDLRARTFALIGAVIRVDIPKANEYLDPEAVAYFPEEPSGIRILDWVTPNLSGQYRVHEWAVLDQQASIDGPTSARTQFRVRVTAEQSSLPYIGWVRFNWRKDAEGQWRVKSVEEIARNALGG